MGLLHLAPLDEVDRHGECLVDMRRRLTFDEFRTSVGACAERLAASGVGRG